MRATGATKETSKRRRSQRRAAACEIESRGVNPSNVVKMLHHANKGTTAEHYAVNPAYEAVFALAGCDDLKGLDYERMSGLLFDELRSASGKHRDLVFSTLPLWFRKWHEHIGKVLAYKINVRLFMHDVFESMAEFIEGAAMFRIEDKHQDYEFYNYEPFTTSAFDSFVSDLRAALDLRRPVGDNLARSRRYIETGNIQSAMSSMAEAQIASTGRQLRKSNEHLVRVLENTLEQRFLPLVGNMMSTLARGLGAPDNIVASLTEGATGNALTPALANAPSVMMHAPSQGVAASSDAAATSSGVASHGGVAALAPTRNKEDPTTWPETSTWLATLRLIKPKHLGDLYNEWNNGYMAWPPLGLLEEKYSSRSRNAWRKQHDKKLNDMVRWRKGINSHMKTPAERDALQEEFYEWHEEKGTGARDSHLVMGWTPIRAFYDEVLRKRKAGFDARSIEMKKRRKVGVESAAASAAAAAAAGAAAGAAAAPATE